MGLRHGSLFTGIGMIDYGLEMAGFKTVWQVEIDPYCLDILERHWPGVPRLPDVRGCGEHNLEPVDIISGGFPCTNISSAGLREGIGTPENPTGRSGLWYEYHRIVRELRPRWVLIENVSRLLHTTDGDRVLADMEGEGYACWPLVLGIGILGAPHERKRAWVLCRRDDPDGHYDDGGGLGPGELLEDIRRKVEEARQEWVGLEHELDAGDGSEVGNTGESEAEAYRGIMREVYGDSRWVDKYRCCGNSVVWVIPALIGAFISQAEEATHKEVLCLSPLTI